MSQVQSSTIGKVIYGHTVSFVDDPNAVGIAQAVEETSDGALAISSDGRIAWKGQRVDLPDEYQKWDISDRRGCLVSAGFIDAHVHFPQYRMLAAPGKDLLDWLNRFTFKEESQYGDVDHATHAADKFLDFLVMNGTTSAMAFSSVHKSAADVLFKAADARGMAFFTGKTMMDRNAPNNVLDTAEQSGIEAQKLINDWHGINRLRYAITPRFAITSTDAQLQVTGELYKNNSDCFMQTHLSESPGEIEFVKDLFPKAKDYTDVYDQFGLLGRNSFFGHGVHLGERECSVLSESQSSVVHCPTSNMFLGSGIIDRGHLRNPSRPVKTCLATDVGGGTSYSMLHTMGEAYKVAIANNYPYSGHEGFYISTLGNAKRLGLADEIGSLKVGNWADLVVIDPKATPVLESRHALSETLEDILFSLIILGDDRVIKTTYVAGEIVHG
jgi:guanine deaminase